MMAAVSAMAARVGESSLGQRWSKVADFLDCAIPIMLVTAIIAGTGAIVFGFVQ